MTFAAVSPWVAWLVILLAAVAALAIFVIKPRPPKRVVSSMLVWHRVLDEGRERSWWDRVRWYVSLALAVTIAVAMALAWAKPSPGASSVAAARILIVLDSSWSMLAATPDGGTRWDRAIRGARAVVDASAGADVALATTAEGVLEGPTADRALLDSALARARPSGGVEGAWPRIADAAVVHFFSDGVRPRLIEPDVAVHSVFSPAPNVAVTALDVRASPGGGGASDVFVTVANYAPAQQAVHLTVTRGAATLFDRTIAMAPEARHSEALTIPTSGEPRLRARVSAANNALGIDDDVTTWLAAADPLTVAVVGQASTIPKLLASDPGMRVFVVDPAGYGQATADVFVFDRWLPDRPPGRPALIVGAPASAWLGALGTGETDPVWRVGPAHDILDGVDMSMLELETAQAVVRPTLRAIAASERDTPLVSVEDTPAARLVVFGFSIQDSNLSVTPAFPVLIGNAIDWLARATRATSRRPGPIMLPTTTDSVLAPDGRALPLVKLADRVTTTLQVPGLYLVEAAGVQRVVNVTLDEPAASDLGTSTLPPITADAAGAPRGAAGPWWRVAAIAALLLVAVEWLTWQRRITV